MHPSVSRIGGGPHFEVGLIYKGVRRGGLGRGGTWQEFCLPPSLPPSMEVESILIFQWEELLCETRCSVKSEYNLNKNHLAATM